MRYSWSITYSECYGGDSKHCYLHAKNIEEAIRLFHQTHTGCYIRKIH